MSDFPIDWNEWSSEFKRWLTSHPEFHTASRSSFPKANMLASDTYVFRTPVGLVELSEVTFPDFGSRSMESKFRRVGVTWLVNGECVNGGLASNFEELDRILVGPPSEEV